MLKDDERQLLKLGDYLEKQLEIDQLQLELMKVIYSNCYKIHLQKKLKTKQTNVIGLTERERSLKYFLEIIDDCAKNQSWFPNKKEKRVLDIGEEGWTIMAHWMIPIFKKVSNNSKLELFCETCGQLECISQAFEKFNTKRNELEPKPLNPFEKFVDVWSQHRMFEQTMYLLNDHASANAFSKGFSNCTMTYFNFGKELQGPNPKEPHILVSVLEALTQNSSIYSISISDLLLVHGSVVKAICKLIRNKKGLTRIVFSQLSISKTLYSSEIIEAVLESPSLEHIEIHNYGEIESNNFRFLEKTPSALLYKLASHPFKSFSFHLHDFQYPIDSLTILEGMLKNRFLKRIEFRVENESPRHESLFLGEFNNRVCQLIDSIQEFHFDSFYIPSVVGVKQNMHLMKTSGKSSESSLKIEVMKGIIQDGLYSIVPEKLILDCNSLESESLGFSCLTHFCQHVKSLTLTLSNSLEEKDWEMICSAIYESETLEDLTFDGICDFQSTNLKFSQYFSKPNLKLSSIAIGTDYETIVSDTNLTVDYIKTFLNLTTFPNLTSFTIGNYFIFDYKCMEALTESIKNQQAHYPLGLKKLLLPEKSINSKCTNLLFNSLMYNRTIAILGIVQAELDNVDVFADFIITNKAVLEIRLDYSKWKENLGGIVIEDGFHEECMKVFGALQLNWKMRAIDWFDEYYYSMFVLGSRNCVGERFLCQRIMDRNKKQEEINKLMNPIRQKMSFTDIEIKLQIIE